MEFEANVPLITVVQLTNVLRLHNHNILIGYWKDVILVFYKLN